MRDQRITVIGDMALVRAVTQWVRVLSGEAKLGMTCYTDTYVLVSERWLCVQAHLTSVAPAHYPPDSTTVVQYKKGVMVEPPEVPAGV